MQVRGNLCRRKLKLLLFASSGRSRIKMRGVLHRPGARPAFRLTRSSFAHDALRLDQALLSFGVGIKVDVQTGLTCSRSDKGNPRRKSDSASHGARMGTQAFRDVEPYLVLGICGMLEPWATAGPRVLSIHSCRRMCWSYPPIANFSCICIGGRTDTSQPAASMRAATQRNTVAPCLRVQRQSAVVTRESATELGGETETSGIGNAKTHCVASAVPS